jgi:Protein of unknown function (DUF3592)
VVFGVTGLLVTTVHGRQARAFERTALQAQAVVVRPLPAEGGWQDHVLVRFEANGRRVEAQAPAIDARKYTAGKSVGVLYDPDHPHEIRLDEERYNAEGPFLFWSAVAVGGLLPIIMGCWWVGRVRRLATVGGPAFAMVASVADEQQRPWSPKRRWVTLYSLDAASDRGRPVGSYPAMSETKLRVGTEQSAEVKGNVRDGGLVVARVGDRIAWPRRRLRV